MKNICSGASRYKGIRKPTCGCRTCANKWKVSSALRAAESLGPTGIRVLTNAQLNRFYGEVFRGSDRLGKTKS